MFYLILYKLNVFCTFLNIDIKVLKLEYIKLTRAFLKNYSFELKLVTEAVFIQASLKLYTDLTPSHFSACTKTGHGFPKTYMSWCFCVQWFKVRGCLFVLLIFFELLNITLYFCFLHNICLFIILLSCKHFK